MAKETKIGLSVIGILLVVFTVVAARRIWHWVGSPTASIPGAAEGSVAAPLPAAELGRVMRPPTIVQSKDVAAETPAAAGGAWVGVGDSYPAEPASAGGPENFRTSFLPNSESLPGRSRFRAADRAPTLESAGSDNSSGLPHKIQTGAPAYFAPSPPQSGGYSPTNPGLDPNRLLPPPPLDGGAQTLPPVDDRGATDVTASFHQDSRDNASTVNSGSTVRLAGLENYPPPVSTLAANEAGYAAGQDSHAGGAPVDARTPLSAGRWGHVGGEPPVTSVAAATGYAASAPPYAGHSVPPANVAPAPYASPMTGTGIRADLAPRAAAMPANGIYVVEPNDNFWTISQKVYGSGGYFRALHHHNRKRFERADQLRIGDQVTVPELAELRKMYGDLCPRERPAAASPAQVTAVSARARMTGGKTYVVKEGDTLTDIARFELGRAARWVEIFQLNRDLLGGDPDYLPVGTHLILPQDGPIDRVTRNPGEMLR